ncbi:MAG: B12-binding domain-containing radical SAM protein, partial [Nitrospinota bacterium]
NPDRELIMDLDILPMPLRKIRPSRFGEGGDGYTIDSVFSSRGCIAKCTFCSNNTVNKTLRNRSPEHFVAELELLHDKNQRKVVKFWDSVFLFDPKRVERILELMFKKNLTNFKIVTESRSNDVIRCRHLLPELKRIGFHKLQIGIESPDPETLKKLKKGGSIAKHEEAIRLIKENGIKLEAFFIIGHPHETDKDIRKYPEYSDKLGIGHGALFFVMTPYPGTQIYQEYNAKSLIKSFEWDIYNNFGAVIQLDHVDRERLLDLLAYCYGRVQGIPHAFTKAKTIPRFIGMFLAFAFLWLLLYHIQTNRPEGKERFFEYLLEAGEGRYRKKRKRKALSKALGFLFAKVEFLFIVSEKKKLLFRFTMNKDTFELKTSYTERPKKRVLTLTLSDLDEVRQSIDIYDINAIMFLLQRKKRLLKEVPHFLPAIATTLRTLFVVGSRVGRRYFIG